MDWPPQYDPGYMPHPDAEHWDARLETMAPAERDALILDKARRQVGYAWERSGFYREFWRDAPVDPANLRSLEGFRAPAYPHQGRCAPGAGSPSPLRAVSVRAA